MEEDEEISLDDLQEIGIVEEAPLLQWVQLPNDEPAVIVGMFDIFGELTTDNEEAVRLVAKDRFGRTNVINVTSELVNKEVVLQ